MKAELRDNPILGGQEREVKQAMGFTESGQWGEGKPGDRPLPFPARTY